ncbi:MAG: 23S rRNA (adenine(2503)-C(2))-methyltransferase RlmN, partial [Alcanivorax sp.]|nr:23S rRNA (adenine(2503)-C(2))-methyltransferase RlmN [Alcanivorax sp.]
MTTQQKVNLLGLSRPQMEEFFLEMGEKKFRAQQILKWIHHHQADSFEQMTDVGKALRQKLSEVAEIRGPDVAHESISRDGTRKWV